MCFNDTVSSFTPKLQVKMPIFVGVANTRSRRERGESRISYKYYTDGRKTTGKSLGGTIEGRLLCSSVTILGSKVVPGRRQSDSSRYNHIPYHAVFPRSPCVRWRKGERLR